MFVVVRESSAAQPYGLCAYTWFGSAGDIVVQPVKAEDAAKITDVTISFGTTTNLYKALAFHLSFLYITLIIKVRLLKLF